MKNKEDKGDDIETEDLSNYNKFYNLPCRVLRRHVWHGIEEEGAIQTITCLSCGDEYKFHIDGRNKIEVSLWKLYEEIKDEVDLSPPPKKRPKKRWNPRYLFSRGLK